MRRKTTPDARPHRLDSQVDQHFTGTRALETRIRKDYAMLPESERRIADMILEFPGEIAAYSATELAQLAGGSKASVTRLIQRLGYDNYEAARRDARDNRDWGSPLYLLSRDAGVEQSTASGLKDHLQRDIDNMVRTFGALDAAELDQILVSLTDARKVWLAGYRSSHLLAAYAHFQFMQAREDVHLLPAGAETMAEYLASMSGEDLFVVIGFRRRMPQLRLALETVAKSGGPILYITDPTARESVSFARWTILCEVAGVGVFDSYSAAFSLVHYLSVALIAKTGTQGRQRLKQIEDTHDVLSDFG